MKTEFKKRVDPNSWRQPSGDIDWPPIQRRQVADEYQPTDTLEGVVVSPNSGKTS